jgi:hypothetical protein
MWIVGDLDWTGAGYMPNYMALGQSDFTAVTA